jgi:hypothetical protein
MRTTHRVPTLMLALMATLVTGCKLSPQEYATIDAWLRCDECQRGERAAVKAIGGKAVHTLDRALIGPSASRIANMEAQWRQTYSMLGPSAVSESAYVAHFRGNYVAGYQTRAAISLGDIGGSRAKRALRRALGAAGPRGYRSDVVRVITAVLATTDLPRFEGTVRGPLASSAARFGDTVRVSQGSGLAWNGNVSIVLQGAPFPSDSDLVVTRDTLTHSLAFLAVGETGPYPLLVTNLGGRRVTQVATLTITSLLDASDRALMNCPGHGGCLDSVLVVPTSSIPRKIFVSFGATTTDTLNALAFRPLAQDTITARLDWPGAVNLDLAWRDCVSFSEVGTPSGTTTSNPESTRVIIPAGACRLLVMTGGPGPAIARLRLTSP